MSDWEVDRRRYYPSGRARCGKKEEKQSGIVRPCNRLAVRIEVTYFKNGTQQSVKRCAIHQSQEPAE